MTILSAMQSAAIRLVGYRPSVFFGSEQQFEQELCDMANEVAADIAQYQDWRALIAIATISADGVESDFALPSDYDRMTQAGELADLDAWAWGYRHVSDINAFTRLSAGDWGPAPGVWTIYGGSLRFAPVPAVTASASFPYVSKDYARADNTAPKSEFTADTDNFVLPERLLTLGLVWRWRENKKLDAGGDQEAFIKALDEYAAKDGGSRTIRHSAGRGFPGTHVAYPWALGPSTYLDH